MAANDEVKQLILATLPSDGSAVNRYEVQRLVLQQCGVDVDAFMAARNQLIDSGEIVASRGRGGPLRRVVALQEPESPERQKEDALYPPMSKVIETDWAQDRRYSAWHVVTTARQGRRNTGGIWSRPDLVLVAKRHFAHVPGDHLEVVTFEVKPPDYFDVTAIYEALAHKEKAHLAYVIVASLDEGEVAPAIREVAERHGVGIIVASKPDEYETWAEIVRPSRATPDPELLDEFIAIQMGKAAHEFLRGQFPSLKSGSAG